MQKFSLFSAMSAEKLIATIKTTSARVGSANIELGKALFALDEKRDGKGTLKKYVRTETGIEVPDHAFCCAVAFNIVGEGLGTITEEQFDNTPLRWLLQVSAILNLLEKAESMPETEKAAIREEVAEILRESFKNGYAALEEIKNRLQPKPETAPGEGETEEEENLSTASDFLSIDHIKEMGRQAAACDDVAKLLALSKALPALLEVVNAKAESLKEAPEAVAA